MVDDLAIDGHTVIAKGATAQGKITKVIPQRLRRPGSLEFSVDSVKTVDGANVKLVGKHAAEGSHGLVTANELTIDSGLLVTAKSDGDQSLNIAYPSKTTPSAVFPISTPSVEGREAGIYLKDGEKMVQLEPSVFSGGKSGGMLTSALTYGIKKMKWKAVVRSARTAQKSDRESGVLFLFREPGFGSQQRWCVWIVPWCLEPKRICAGQNGSQWKRAGVDCRGSRSIRSKHRYQRGGHRRVGY